MAEKDVLEWVRMIVLRLIRSRGLMRLEESDLVSAGMWGYAQATDRFREGNGAQFKTFAEYRIRGAVLDEVRRIIGDERVVTPRPIQDQEFEIDRAPDPINGAWLEEVDVERFIKTLPLDSRESNVLAMRMQGFTMKEIGERHNVSESRISQIMGRVRLVAASKYRGHFGYAARTSRVAWKRTRSEITHRHRFIDEAKCDCGLKK